MLNYHLKVNQQHNPDTVIDETIADEPGAREWLDEQMAARQAEKAARAAQRRVIR